MFVDEVKALTTTHYKYAGHPVSSEPLIKALTTRELTPYDSSMANVEDYEDEFVRLLHSMKWRDIMTVASSFDEIVGDEQRMEIHRRGLLKHMDYFRGFLKRGDQ